MKKSPVTRQLSRFIHERRGNVAMLSALLVPVFLGAAAFAVDEGSLYLERRQMQADTDLAAITAAANIEKAEQAALLTMGDNGRPNVTIADPEDLDGEDWPRTPEEASQHVMAVEKGSYSPDPNIAPEQRFIAGQEPENAVRVTLRDKGTLYFARRFIEEPPIRASAIAASWAEAAFSVGSRLASIDEGVLNAMLGSLIGSEISLRAMDYRSLLGADIDVFRFAENLSTELGIFTGTYEDVLKSRATIGQVFTAASAAIDGGQSARIALLQLADSASSELQIPLSHLLDLGSLGKLAIGDPNPGLDADLGVMRLIGASAAIANREHQVQLDTGIELPGLLEVSVDLAIGEPPQHRPFFAIGEAGTTVRTGQTRLRLVVNIGGPGGLLGPVVRLPLYVEAGYAEAKLRNATCSGGKPQRVVLDAQPGVLEAWIGEIDPGNLRRFESKPLVRKAGLIDLRAVKVTGSAHAMAGDTAPTQVNFDRHDIEDGAVKSVSTRDLSRSLVQTLLRDLDLDVELLGLDIGLIPVSVVKDQLAEILGAVTGELDEVLYNLLTTVGIRVGEADLRVTGVSCHRAVLVN